VWGMIHQVGTRHRAGPFAVPKMGPHAVDDLRPVKSRRLTSSPQPANRGACQGAAAARDCGIQLSTRRRMHGQQSRPPTDPPPSGCIRAIAVGALIRYLGRMKIDNAGLMSWKFGADSVLAGSALIGAPGPRNFEDGTARWADCQDFLACRLTWVKVRM
jgi:hypothetical protein